MPVISLTENDTKCYGVKIENKGLFKVQKYKNIYDNEHKFLCVKPLETFLGKCGMCNMLSRAGALDKSVSNGNTCLLKLSEENNFKNKYVYMGGDMVCSFLTNDCVYNYISKMGINLILYSIAVGEDNVYVLSPYYKFTKKVKIKDSELLKTDGNSVDPFDYLLEKQGPDCFEYLLEFTRNHQC